MKHAKRPSHVSDHDLQRIIAHTAADSSLQDLHEAIVIIADTGLRKGELAGLRWSDVDLDQRSITVPISGRRSSIRHVFFPEQTHALLLARRQRNPDEEFVCGPITRVQRLGWQLRKVSRALGFECRFQLLRRTFATRLCNSGADILSVCFLLGVNCPSEWDIIERPSEAKPKLATERLGEV